MKIAIPTNYWKIPGKISLPVRAAMLAGVFFLEKTFLTQFVDLRRADAAVGLGELFRHAQHFGFRFLVALVAALILFSFTRASRRSLTRPTTEFRPAWMAAHVGLLVCLAWLSSLLFPSTPTAIPFGAVVGFWLTCATGGVLCAFAAMAPLPLWLKTARALGNIWFYSVAVGLAAATAIPLSQELWRSTAAATFDLVRLILMPILPGLTADPATRILGTQRFAVEILEFCSGLEGMSLILVFLIAWLWYFRKEYCFPRALLLIPFGMALMFGLNAVRVAVLVLIGNAGHPEVAEYGFHSQAGWIAFNAVSVGIAAWSRRRRWLNRSVEPLELNQTENPTAVFLMPLIAILAAGMLSHAMSGRFEWFYPLRVLACAGVLVIYRRQLAVLDWRWSWRGLLLGCGVLIVWFSAIVFLLPALRMPDPLAAASPELRWSWIICRVAGAVLTVPLAEELAYRGFLMRRLQSREFDSLEYSQVGWVAITASAVLFGVVHGAMWLPGLLAGFAYGWIVKRQGRLGEAVIAHMVTNLGVAAFALGSGNWAGF